ncbi:MAG: GntR family transcriptional regulator [Clostridiales bacterium]|nr:GntR family transcriptional regulator [Clostridiales bacterium]MCD8368073.1 GntR family transcriptional regulator [Clostridiales bacterium]
MEWKLSSDRPIWLQLKEELTRRIVTGQYPMGSRFPTVRELAAEAGVNPNTMQRALSELEKDGLVESNRTAGRLVTSDARQIEEVRGQLAAQLMEEFCRGMERLGYTAAQAQQKLKEENPYE